MRTLVHLSDLHFGRIRPELETPLLTALHAAEPDLVVVSGDLTQRARDWQFRQARTFLDRIRPPCLVVPGNHDVPLDNLPVRLLAPWQRYRRWIAPELEPGYQDAELSVIGINTVNTLDWQRGRISHRKLAQLCRGFGAQQPDARTRILVAHHPFAQEAGERKALMRGARGAIRALSGCGADIVLCGHLHVARAEPILLESGQASRLLLVQAGTGLSSRLRGEENDFNVLRVTPQQVTIDRMSAASPKPGFILARRLVFQRAPDGWTAVQGEVETIRA